MFPTTQSRWKIVLQPPSASDDFRTVQFNTIAAELDLLEVPRIEPHTPAAGFALNFDDGQLEVIAGLAWRQVVLVAARQVTHAFERSAMDGRLAAVRYARVERDSACRGLDVERI
jgi:hypothetical protein